MLAQAKIEGRYLGGRPPYGCYRLVNGGPHADPAKAADGKVSRVARMPVVHQVLLLVAYQHGNRSGSANRAKRSLLAELGPEVTHSSLPTTRTGRCAAERAATSLSARRPSLARAWTWSAAHGRLSRISTDGLHM